MAFVNFRCTRSLLVLINIFYIILSIILIAVSAYAKSISIITSNDIIIGIIVCGVLLFIVSFIGLIGTIRHDQVLLFFYISIMFMIFFIQFIIALVCLFMSYRKDSDLWQMTWERLDNQTKHDIQITFNCCGYKNATIEHADCNGVVNTSEPCYYKLSDSIAKALKLCGTVGLIFSFSQVLGAYLAIKFRNLRDPKWNSNQFL